jgi:hypothetical protein
MELPIKKFVISAHGINPIYSYHPIEGIELFTLPYNVHCITISTIGEILDIDDVTNVEAILDIYKSGPLFEDDNKSEIPTAIGESMSLIPTTSILQVKNHMPMHITNNLVLTGALSHEDPLKDYMRYWEIGNESEYTEITDITSLKAIVNEISRNNPNYNCIILLISCRNNNRIIKVDNIIENVWFTINKHRNHIINILKNSDSDTYTDELVHFLTDEFTNGGYHIFNVISDTDFQSIIATLQKFRDDPDSLNMINFSYELYILPPDPSINSPRMKRHPSIRTGITGNRYTSKKILALLKVSLDSYILRYPDKNVADLQESLSDPDVIYGHIIKNMYLQLQAIPLIDVITKCVQMNVPDSDDSSVPNYIDKIMLCLTPLSQTVIDAINKPIGKLGGLKSRKRRNINKSRGKRNKSRGKRNINRNKK